MDDEQVMHALNLDDLYRVERTLAKGAGGLTELVTLGGAGPFVRKKTPLKLANQNVWAAIGSVDCPRVPKVQSTYLLPDQLGMRTIFWTARLRGEPERPPAAVDRIAHRPVPLAERLDPDRAAPPEPGVVHRKMMPQPPTVGRQRVERQTPVTSTTPYAAGSSALCLMLLIMATSFICCFVSNILTNDRGRSKGGLASAAGSMYPFSTT